MPVTDPSGDQEIHPAGGMGTMAVTLGRFLSRSATAIAASALSLAVYGVMALLDHRRVEFIDLQVYLTGARVAASPTLYDVVATKLDLPFTYPPFAAALFSPLTLLPWPVAATLFTAISMGSLYACLAMMASWLAPDVPRQRRLAFAGSLFSLALWIEPIRTTLTFGQVNLMLMALVLCAATTSRRWLSSALVGVAAGIKLIPSANLVYFAVLRQWRTAVGVVVVFLGTLTLGFVINPTGSAHYVGHLLFAPDRAGALWDVNNQSLRGALARFTGTDSAPRWLAAAVVVGALGVWAALRRRSAGDPPGALVAVQLTILLISPISWNHHWVWCLLVIAWAGNAFVRSGSVPLLVVGVLWALAGWSNIVATRINAKEAFSGPARPWADALLDSVYPLLGLLTLVIIGAVDRRSRPVSTSVS